MKEVAVWRGESLKCFKHTHMAVLVNYQLVTIEIVSSARCAVSAPKTEQLNAIETCRVVKGIERQLLSLLKRHSMTRVKQHQPTAPLFFCLVIATVSPSRNNG